MGVFFCVFCFLSCLALLFKLNMCTDSLPWFRSLQLQLRRFLRMPCRQVRMRKYMILYYGKNRRGCMLICLSSRNKCIAPTQTASGLPSYISAARIHTEDDGWNNQEIGSFRIHRGKGRSLKNVPDWQITALWA